mmetsp:Transcript_1008/g.2237  ORF Transcript_1008/g.2237 Transcript_1008/m.2237 type:complete len:210 (-) Transcript_1008:140-769(-)
MAIKEGSNGEEVKKRVATVNSRAFSFSSEEDMYTTGDALVVSSHQDVITTVKTIYIDDCHGNPLAKISEQNHHHESAVSQYTIQNGDGDIVAVSNMQKNYGTQVDVTDQLTGKRLWTATTPWLQLADSWKVEMRKGAPASLATDPRIVITLLAEVSAPTMGLGPVPAWFFSFSILTCFCCCWCGITLWSRNENEKSRWMGDRDEATEYV